MGQDKDAVLATQANQLLAMYSTQNNMTMETATGLGIALADGPWSDSPMCARASMLVRRWQRRDAACGGAVHHEQRWD